MRYRRVPHLACRKVVDETIVVDLRKNLVFGLNDSGAWVLDVLRAGRDPESIARALTLSAGRQGSDAADVSAFLDELRAVGAIEADPEHGDADESPVVTACFDVAPSVLWQERLDSVVGLSPPSAVGDPGCGF